MAGERMDDIEDESGSDESEECGDMFPSEDKNVGSKKRTRESNDDDTKGEQTMEPQKKKKKKHTKANELKKLEKPATVEELNRLRETENLFHSNLFRRQIEEMLKELEIKNKMKVRVNTWFDAFKSWVEKIESKTESHDLSNFDWMKELKLKLPLAVANVETKGNYRFKKPTDIKLVGSYCMKTWLKGDPVDINVTMPSQFFDKEDYLNGRYYVKRAMYLCQLAKHISTKKDLVQEIKFSVVDGDNWRPMIELVPAGKLSNSHVLIHLVAEQSSFRSQRFAPLRNNVRSRWLFQQKHELKDEDCPSPDYNTGILRDLRSEANEAYLKDLVAGSDHIRDAIVLLKVWARQRDLLTGPLYEIFPFIIAYLFQIRKVNQTMSSYQIIRAVWNYLGVATWREAGITMCQSSGSGEPSLADFHSQFPIVFVDSSGFLNLCAGMCPTQFQRCQDEAIKSVKNLDTPDINCFQILFMVPAPFSRLCDHTVVFHNWAALEKMVQVHSAPETKIKTGNVTFLQARELIVSLLEKALGARAHRIFVGPIARKSWNLDKKPKIASSLFVGIILDPDHCFNLVNKGPDADSEEAKAFRSLWKEKSELRRFKDGSITESVVWSGKTWPEKRMICRQITHFVLETHLNLAREEYSYLGDELEAWLPAKREDQISEVHTTFDQLAKDLRGLTDLPLNVISTQGASSVFRWSDIFPPEMPPFVKTKKQGTTGNCLLVDPSGHTVPPWCSPALVILQLGSSNKWPKELEAVRRIRTAFNLKIAELLQKKGYVTHAYLDWVDVLTDACVFRLRIVYPGEIGLMKKTASPDGIIMYRDTKESVQLEKVAVHLPNLTSSLNGLQSQFNSYGTACCLAKRWVRSHLFHEEHISDEAIDLLVAAAYVNPEPWRPPNQPQTAFLRFIALLALTDWNLECIILNFNQILTKDEKRQIETHVSKNRATLPCMFIATPDDREKSVWTSDGPCAVVLHRLAALAARTLNLVTAHFNAPQNEFSALSLLQPSTGVFDVLIQLKLSSVPRRHESVSCDAKRRESGSSKYTDVIPITDYDPTRFYLKELQDAYGDWCMFFYDPYGGTAIGVVWKPGSKQPKPLKMTHLQNRAWDHENNTLILNEFAILQGFQLIGAGLVKSVQVKEGNTFVDVHL